MAQLPHPSVGPFPGVYLQPLKDPECDRSPLVFSDNLRIRTSLVGFPSFSAYFLPHFLTVLPRITSNP